MLLNNFWEDLCSVVESIHFKIDCLSWEMHTNWFWHSASIQCILPGQFVCISQVLSNSNRAIFKDNFNSICDKSVGDGFQFYLTTHSRLYSRAFLFLCTTCFAKIVNRSDSLWMKGFKTVHFGPTCSIARYYCMLVKAL